MPSEAPLTPKRGFFRNLGVPCSLARGRGGLYLGSGLICTVVPVGFANYARIPQVLGLALIPVAAACCAVVAAVRDTWFRQNPESTTGLKLARFISTLIAETSRGELAWEPVRQKYHPLGDVHLVGFRTKRGDTHVAIGFGTSRRFVAPPTTLHVHAGPRKAPADLRYWDGSFDTVSRPALRELKDQIKARERGRNTMNAKAYRQARRAAREAALHSIGGS